MGDSIQQLTKMTEALGDKVDNFDEYGVAILLTVDEKLENATTLIKDAQQSLATAKADGLVRDAADVVRAERVIEKDAEIVQLKQDLKDSNDRNK